jgi:hypothetical protein
MPAGPEASGRSHARRTESRPGRRAESHLACSASVLHPPPLAALPVGSDRRCWRARSFPNPAPARPSLAVSLFGRSAGEHARGPAQCADHIPLGPGREAVPAGFSGQSRPNPIHGSIVGRADYFSATTGLLLSYLGRVLKIARKGWGEAAHRGRTPGRATSSADGKSGLRPVRRPLAAVENRGRAVGAHGRRFPCGDGRNLPKLGLAL